MNKIEFFKKKVFFLWSKQCNDMNTFGGGGGDILGQAISLIFDQLSIL